MPEVTFSVFGERGSIDILAWHARSRSLLVIELKTELVDLQDTVSTLDRKVRLAMKIARERGWEPASVSTWLVIAEGRHNRRSVERHAAFLRSRFPADGHAVMRWLRRPVARVEGAVVPVIRPLHEHWTASCARFIASGGPGTARSTRATVVIRPPGGRYRAVPPPRLA